MAAQLIRTAPIGMNYKVKVDEKGLLRWERNNELVDTTAGRWQDSGDGTGIVPYDAAKGEPPTVVRRTSFEVSPPVFRPSTSGISAGSIDSQNATHYVDTARINNPVHRWLRTHLTVKGWAEMLLRKTVRKNTWIYVVDKHCEYLLLLVTACISETSHPFQSTSSSALSVSFWRARSRVIYLEVNKRLGHSSTPH